MQTIPDSLTGVRGPSGWLKAGLLSTLMLAVCWAGAIAWWRASARVPATGELVIVLFVLPLGLLLAFWGGRKLLAHRAATTVTPTIIPVPVQVAPSKTPTLAILATALRLPHGASPEHLSTALATNKARAELDPELLDDGGFPVMTARSELAHDDALRDQITSWLAENGVTDPSFTDEQWRALTLATQVADELANQAVSMLMLAEGTRPPIRLLTLLPNEWASEQRRAAGQWLKYAVAQSGWPPSGIELADDTPDTNETSPAALINRLAHQAVSSNAPVSALVVACASHIGDASLAQWTADDSLFTSAQPQGRIPGEGAAGLLVTDQRQAHSIDAASTIRLDAIQEVRRNASADERRRASSQQLAGLIGQALDNGGIAATDVARVVADTGQRANRVLELMGSVAAMMQLDVADELVRVGLASGSCDAVPFVAALALGHHYASKGAAHVLCVSNEDPYRLGVALVRSGDA